MQDIGAEKWELLNKTNKEIDDIYHQFALKNNLSDTTFWIFYNLYVKGECTQKDICSEWQFPKQTINSAIKELSNKKYIELRHKEDNRKSKIISLTNEGREISEKIIKKVVDIEQRVYTKTNKEEFDKVIKFFQEQATLLREEFKKEN